MNTVGETSKRHLLMKTKHGSFILDIATKRLKINKNMGQKCVNSSDLGFFFLYLSFPSILCADHQDCACRHLLPATETCAAKTRQSCSMKSLLKSACAQKYTIEKKTISSDVGFVSAILRFPSVMCVENQDSG